MLEIVHAEVVVDDSVLVFFKVVFEQYQVENHAQLYEQVFEYFLQLGLNACDFVNQFLQLRVSQHKQFVHEVEVFGDFVFESEQYPFLEGYVLLLLFFDGVVELCLVVAFAYEPVYVFKDAMEWNGFVEPEFEGLFEVVVDLLQHVTHGFNAVGEHTHLLFAFADIQLELAPLAHLKCRLYQIELGVFLDLWTVLQVPYLLLQILDFLHLDSDGDVDFVLEFAVCGSFTYRQHQHVGGHLHHFLEEHSLGRVLALLDADGDFVGLTFDGVVQKHLRFPVDRHILLDGLLEYHFVGELEFVVVLNGDGQIGVLFVWNATDDGDRQPQGVQSSFVLRQRNSVQLHAAFIQVHFVYLFFVSAHEVEILDCFGDLFGVFGQVLQVVPQGFELVFVEFVVDLDILANAGFGSGSKHTDFDVVLSQKEQDRSVIQHVDYLHVDDFLVDFDLPDCLAVLLYQDCVVFVYLNEKVFVGHGNDGFVLQSLKSPHLSGLHVESVEVAHAYDLYEFSHFDNVFDALADVGRPLGVDAEGVEFLLVVCRVGVAVGLDLTVGQTLVLVAVDVHVAAAREQLVQLLDLVELDRDHQIGQLGLEHQFGLVLEEEHAVHALHADQLGAVAGLVLVAELA